MKKSAVAPRDKYFLKSLHQEIDLYDRKLADLRKFGQFDSVEDRKQAEHTFMTKRASLEKTARELSASGVEYNEQDLPRSFREQPEQGLSQRAS
ncbi:hypothetical protein [Occallatibacter savannae]|uniref:hypothetical protein n=1 Tax=Occallatibacter savannae TaxID=1002691 RepID=UPI000D68AB83|nr:hypothetical protein [Occallatibacter savannae]